MHEKYQNFCQTCVVVIVKFVLPSGTDPVVLRSNQSELSFDLRRGWSLVADWLIGRHNAAVSTQIGPHRGRKPIATD